MKDNPNNHNGFMKAYHCILDSALQSMPGSCFSVFYYIYRQTIGWNKFVDGISIFQFIENTGLKRNCVLDSIEKLESLRWIHVQRNATAGGRPFNLYSLGESVWKTNQYQLEIPTDAGKTDQLEIPTNTSWKFQPKKSKTSLKFKHTKDILKDTNENTKEAFWDFSKVVYDRYKPPEEMYRLEHALNEIYPMSNLWIEDDFDNLQFLMENFRAEEVIALAGEAKESGVNCNSALSWIVERIKEGKNGSGSN